MGAVVAISTETAELVCVELLRDWTVQKTMHYFYSKKTILFFFVKEQQLSCFSAQ